MATDAEPPELDPTDLGAAQEREAAHKASAEQQLRFEVNDLQWLMSNKRGRRVMWRLLEQSGVYRLSFDPNSASVTAFNEGQRNYGLRHLALLLEHCGADYAAMLQERTNG